MKKQLGLCIVMGGVLLAMNIACTGQQSSQFSLPEASPPVTTRLKATTLQDALKEVSRLTGQSLSAAADTADLKVTIFVKDLPLDTLRARLAETMHLTWTTYEADKGKPKSYLIYRSKQNKEEELELATRGERAFRKGINDAIAALSLSREARAKLFEERKALAETFAQPGGEAAVTLLARLSPQLRESIMDGNGLEFPSDNPPPELAPYFGEIMKKLTAANSEDANPIFAQLLHQEGKFSVVRTGEGAGSQIGIGFSVQTEMLTGSLGYGVKGVHAGEVYLGVYSPNHHGADYADAHRPITVPTKLTAKSRDDLMEKVADTLHINIVGENYRQRFGPNAKGEVIYPGVAEAGPSTIEKVLDDTIYVDYWWKHGDVYLFQRPLWWVDRRKEVTDSMLATLKGLVQKRPLSFGTMAKIGKMLTAEQAGAVQIVMKEGQTYPTEVEAAMRFYGHLSDLREADLFAGNGTDASVFSDADQQRLHAWIEETGKEALQSTRNAPGHVHVLAIRLPNTTRQDRVLFRAVFQANDGTTCVLREQIITDGYVDPKDPQLHSQR